MRKLFAEQIERNQKELKRPAPKKLESGRKWSAKYLCSPIKEENLMEGADETWRSSSAKKLPNLPQI